MLAAEIAKYLHDLGIGVYKVNSSGSSIFIGKLQDTPDIAICVNPTGGLRSDGTGVQYFPTIQFLTRGTARADTGWEKAMQVYDAMQYFAGRFINNGELVVRCDAIQDSPGLIYRDEKDRAIYSQNFELRVCRTAQNSPV